MSDVLAVTIGVVIGVLASVPVAMVIAVSTRPQTRYLWDTYKTDVTVEPPGTTALEIQQRR